MTTQHVEWLARVLVRHSLARLSWCEGGEEVHLSRANAPTRPQAAPHTLSAPHIGRLLWQHPCHDGTPACVEGEAFAAGDTLAWLAVGPLLRPVRAARAGRLLQRVQSERSLVGYEQTLALFTTLEKG